MSSISTQQQPNKRKVLYYIISYHHYNQITPTSYSKVWNFLFDNYNKAKNYLNDHIFYHLENYKNQHRSGSNNSIYQSELSINNEIEDSKFKIDKVYNVEDDTYTVLLKGNLPIIDKFTIAPIYEIKN